MTDVFELVDDDGILVIAAAAALRIAADDERASNDPLSVLHEVVRTHGAAAWQNGCEGTVRVLRQSAPVPGAIGPWTIHAPDGRIHAMPYSQFTMALVRSGVPETIRGLNHEIELAPGWYDVFVGPIVDGWSIAVLPTAGVTQASLRVVVDVVVD